MFDVKDLTLDQLLALYHMAHFNCNGIDCDECPLFKAGDRLCGSAQAKEIISQCERETDETILSYNIQKRVRH